MFCVSPKKRFLERRMLMILSHAEAGSALLCSSHFWLVDLVPASGKHLYCWWAHLQPQQERSRLLRPCWKSSCVLPACKAPGDSWSHAEGQLLHSDWMAACSAAGTALPQQCCWTNSLHLCLWEPCHSSETISALVSHAHITLFVKASTSSPSAFKQCVWSWGTRLTSQCRRTRAEEVSAITILTPNLRRLLLLLCYPPHSNWRMFLGCLNKWQPDLFAACSRNCPHPCCVAWRHS